MRSALDEASTSTGRTMTDDLRVAVVGALDGHRRDGAWDARRLWGDFGRAGVLEAVLRDTREDARGRAAGPTDGRGAQGGPHLPGLRTLLTELDARAPLGVVLATCVQVATVLPLLRTMAADAAQDARATGAAELTSDVLEGALRGDLVVALAVTDAAAAGSALLDAGTAVSGTQGAEGAVVVDGTKEWITNALTCDYALTLVRHRPARHFTSFRWALVPASASGVRASPAGADLFGAAGLGHLEFDGVELGAAHLVGRPGRAMADFARQIGVERLAGGLWASALCRRVLVDLRAWLAVPPASGAARWENAAVRERFARCVVDLARLEGLLTPLVVPGARTVPAVTGMLLKAAVGETVEQVLGEAVHLRGADAFRDGGEAHLRAQAAMFGLAGGASGAMLAGVAEHADAVLGVAP